MITAATTGAATSATSSVAIIVGILVLIAAYWAPTIVASSRKIHNIGSIAVINGLLGWTVIGWAIALAMACRSRTQSPQYVVPPGWVPPAAGPAGWTPTDAGPTGWTPPPAPDAAPPGSHHHH